MINCIMGNGFVKEFDTSLSNPQFQPLCKDFSGGPVTHIDGL